jgi:hypothetical protein
VNSRVSQRVRSSRIKSVPSTALVAEHLHQLAGITVLMDYFEWPSSYHTKQYSAPMERAQMIFGWPAPGISEDIGAAIDEVNEVLARLQP